ALSEPDDGWRQAASFRVDDDLRLIPLHDGDNGVCGAEVNANNLCHKSFSLLDLSQSECDRINFLPRINLSLLLLNSVQDSRPAFCKPVLRAPRKNSSRAGRGTPIAGPGLSSANSWR